MVGPGLIVGALYGSVYSGVGVIGSIGLCIGSRVLGAAVIHGVHHQECHFCFSFSLGFCVTPVNMG